MLQLDTRPSSSWTSSSTYNADGRSLPAEFSLSTTLQKDINSGVFDLSRLSARSRPPTTATTISDSMHHHQLYQHHNDSIAGGNNNSNKYNTGEHERRSLTTQKTHNNNKKEREEEEEEEEDAELNKIIISRRILSLERERERKAIAKPVQPTRNPATPLETEPETLNLPPIRLASSRTSRSRSRSRSSSSRSSSRSFRASSSPSSSPSPSPSQSPSISPSLLPSIEEPHLPSLRGRLHSASTSASTPTDNTSPTQSSSSKSNFDLVNPAGLIGLTSLPLHLPSSDRIGIDNDATIAATVAAALVDVNVGCRLPPILSGASTNSTTAPTGGSRSRHIEDSSDGRTSKKRTLEEYQGHSDHFSSRRAPASIVHPLSQSLTADSIANPSSSGLPISLAPIDSISASESQLQPSRSSPPNPSVKPVPRRLHESDLPNRTDIDNSVESTIVLAHRAVTAIKNQSLPRPKTIGPTFTIGKQPSHPFGVAGRPHDGVMESEDESDSASTTTTSTPSPLNKPRMMPWDRKKPLREESPALDQNFFPDLDPAPLSGSIIRPDSSPKREPGQPGIGSLINLMGGSTERSRMIAADVRTDQPLQPVDSESESQSPEDTTGDAGEVSKDSTGQAPSTTTNTTNTVLQTIPPISRSIDGHPGDGDGGEDPNDKRSRKLSEHEQDNGSESISSGREKRRKLEELADGVPAEPQIPGKSDQDAAVSSPFGLSKGPSPPPVPSGPPTVESVPSTTATLDSGPAYSESETPATMCGASDYYKSPVETSSNNTLPPIHSPSNHSPGRQNMSPRSTHTTLPSVDNLFTVASAAEKHSMDHQQIQQNHTSHNGKYSKSVVIQHLKIVPNSSPNPTPNTRAYVDGFTRGIAFNDPAQNFRTMVPRPRQSPTVSPIEGRNAPIAPAPANNFSGQASTSPLNQFTPTPTYFPPKNLNRPEHPANHATLPPLQTDWSGSLPPSEPGSARTPTSKKRARNGTPKNGSIDSSQNSPTVAGGFKCNKEGCTAAPFSTQYLLNSHANVHSEDRPHFCPVAGCSRAEGGKGFKRKNEMIRHGLVHQSPGYVCPFCPDKEHRYPRPDNLQRHVKAHHKDKSGDDPLLREVLAVRPEGGQRGRRRRLGPNP